MNSKNQYQIVYSMNIAMQLKDKGFQEISTIPNPKNKKYIAWVFKRTQNFIKAFNELMKEA